MTLRYTMRALRYMISGLLLGQLTYWAAVGLGIADSPVGLALLLMVLGILVVWHALEQRIARKAVVRRALADFTRAVQGSATAGESVRQAFNAGYERGAKEMLHTVVEEW